MIKKIITKKKRSTLISWTLRSDSELNRPSSHSRYVTFLWRETNGNYRMYDVSPPRVIRVSSTVRIIAHMDIQMLITSLTTDHQRCPSLNLSTWSFIFFLSLVHFALIFYIFLNWKKRASFISQLLIFYMFWSMLILKSCPQPYGQLAKKYSGVRIYMDETKKSSNWNQDALHTITMKIIWDNIGG